MLDTRTRRPFRGSALGLVAACVAIVACGSAADRTLNADLSLYLQRANDWSPVEAETAKTIERILATQFVDEAEVRRQVVANAPHVAQHLGRVEQVQPRSPELQVVHRRYVEAWRRLAIGYDRILRGLDTGTVSDIADGRRALEAWRGAIVDTARDLRRLQQDLGT
jgi:hypothetical protein